MSSETAPEPASSETAPEPASSETAPEPASSETAPEPASGEDPRLESTVEIVKWLQGFAFGLTTGATFMLLGLLLFGALR